MTTSPGWVITRVDRVATVKARIGWKALTAAEYQDDGYAFLSTPNIKGADIDFEDVNYINQFRYDESPELKLQVGDVLLAKDGSTLGIANVVRELPCPATVNGSIAVLRPFDVEPRFLMYTLQGSAVQDQIQLLRAGMGVPHLFQWDINRLTLPLPPLDVQRRVADFLDDQVTRIDNIITARKEQVQRSAELRESLLDAALRPLLADSGVPQRSLRQVCPFFTDGDWIESPYITEDGIRLIQTGNIGVGEFKDQGFKFVSSETFEELRCTEVLPGDVLISRLSLPMARACLAPRLDCRMISAVDVVIARPAPEVVRPDFLVLALSTPRHFGDTENLARGATMQRLSRSQVGALRVPLPSLDSQRQMAQTLMSQRSQIAEGICLLETGIQQLQELKRSVITAAVSGEFDVSSADGSGVAG